MQLGLIGLGKMGLNMGKRLARAGHQIVAHDLGADASRRAAEAGLTTTESLDRLVTALTQPRAVWVMVPAGDPTEHTVTALGEHLAPGDAIIDGGNTNFHDDIRRADALAGRGIHHVDAGTSGGIWGLEEGYCLMVGGDAPVCERLEPIFLALAPVDGYLRVGGHGAGHYVKMVHNAIEYGLMQAYAEGFELMHAVALRPRPRQGRRALDARQRRAVLAAGAHGSGVGRAIPSSTAFEATSRIPAKDGGRSAKPSSTGFRCRR